MLSSLFFDLAAVSMCPEWWDEGERAKVTVTGRPSGS